MFPDSKYVCGDSKSFVFLLGLTHIEIGAIIAGVYKKGTGEVRARIRELCEDVFPCRVSDEDAGNEDAGNEDAGNEDAGNEDAGNEDNEGDSAIGSGNYLMGAAYVVWLHYPSQRVWHKT